MGKSSQDVNEVKTTENSWRPPVYPVAILVLSLLAATALFVIDFACSGSIKPDDKTIALCSLSAEMMHYKAALALAFLGTLIWIFSRIKNPTTSVVVSALLATGAVGVSQFLALGSFTVQGQAVDEVNSKSEDSEPVVVVYNEETATKIILTGGEYKKDLPKLTPQSNGALGFYRISIPKKSLVKFEIYDPEDNMDPYLVQMRAQGDGFPPAIEFTNEDSGRGRRGASIMTYMEPGDYIIEYGIRGAPTSGILKFRAVNFTPGDGYVDTPPTLMLGDEEIIGGTIAVPGDISWAMLDISASTRMGSACIAVELKPDKDGTDTVLWIMAPQDGVSPKRPDGPVLRNDDVAKGELSSLARAPADQWPEEVNQYFVMIDFFGDQTGGYKISAYETKVNDGVCDISDRKL
jgi:hypothetical protein